MAKKEKKVCAYCGKIVFIDKRYKHCSRQCAIEKNRKHPPEYYKSPEFLAGIRKYNREYQRKYYWKKKCNSEYKLTEEVKKHRKEYFKRPETRARIREYNKRYYRRRKNAILQKPC